MAITNQQLAKFLGIKYAADGYKNLDQAERAAIMSNNWHGKVGLSDLKGSLANILNRGPSVGVAYQPGYAWNTQFASPIQESASKLNAGVQPTEVSTDPNAGYNPGFNSGGINVPGTNTFTSDGTTTGTSIPTYPAITSNTTTTTPITNNTTTTTPITNNTTTTTPITNNTTTTQVNNTSGTTTPTGLTQADFDSWISGWWNQNKPANFGQTELDAWWDTKDDNMLTLDKLDTWWNTKYPTNKVQTLGTLYPRSNWGNYQTSNRGARYFDSNTGNYNINNTISSGL